MTQKPRIALLTYTGLDPANRQGLTEDDSRLHSQLSTHAQVDVIPWDDPSSSTKLRNADCAILRSTWNYTEHIDRFLDWLNQLEENKVRLFNSVGTVRWNTDKAYLAELLDGGFTVVPTVFLGRGETVDLSDAVAQLPPQPGESYVVKPSISATARGLFLCNNDNLDQHQDRLNGLLQETGVLVQPLMPIIRTEGEWSLMFFGDRYSHAVRKLPARGDIRVQGNFGGKAQLEQPPARFIEQARAILDWVEARFERPLYARVDGIEHEGQFALMELELIEPELFFRVDEQSAVRFVEALRSRFELAQSS